ncbi:dihydrofolate reductase [Methylicorpusculum sp.]|uniref:dihydrofolate reductase n=1 Tax=Methylicorpusculum sp. TaxID=2713644 RepID=UPI002721F422|nr:dihydrofolate reductase [Methylicorpusculum sp.]MDO8845717.1 dihydrofolate reductase [Methylicorpusculum sp.]MDP2177326.1 dihydrofolate reductase [Methylicorpusculum sp.]MDP3531027.1 dihydrofolate reductase [Methylicorpusculum sp.]MDZ4153781.1 dihydrofolate reductase [Methylicorpusculum sp.]
MKLSIIVAMASNNAIGINNQLPWHLSADLKRFKKITMGSPIIMGRHTFESIGRPLPGRTNIIISRNPLYHQPGCLMFNDPDAALAHFKNEHEVFVIGGASLYKTILPIADIIYLTEVKQSFEGDTFFPEINKEHWLETAREDIDDDPLVSFNYSFIKLIRA